MFTPLKRLTGIDAGTAAHRSAIRPPIQRQQWIEACAERLAELNPSLDRAACAAQAAELWSDVGGYDPLIAAEMEYEAGIFDD